MQTTPKRLKSTTRMGFVLCLVCILALSSQALGKGKYLPGDWISYSMFRYITSITQDYNRVYFGTTGGVSRYDRSAQKWDTPFTTSDGLPSNFVTDLAYDPDRNEVWANTGAGAAVYNDIFAVWNWEPSFPQNLSTSDTSKIKLPDLFTEFGPTTSGSDWVMDSHLDRYPISDYLTGEYYDELWVGTWGLNAGLASLRRLQLKMFRFGLYDKDVKALLVDGDQIWFGGTGFTAPSAGITRYDRKKANWEYYVAKYVPFLPSNQVNVIDSDSSYVWFGTEDGLAGMNKKDGRWISYSNLGGLPHNDVTALKSDGRYLWIGTSSGLALFDLEADSLRSVNDPALEDLYVSCILPDSYYVWVGTEYGVFTLDREKQTWYRFSTPEGLLNGWVRSIVRWSDGKPASGQEEIWFGTDNGILGYSPLTDERTAYDNRMNFPGLQVVKLACDDRYLWAATPDGVWKLNRATDIWVRYSTDDGLLDDNVQDLALDGDYIWFGTPQGATRFFWNNPRLRE
jgi:ligand-binding sensor domain-containing protein